jgi:hypothetical protein
MQREVKAVRLIDADALIKELEKVYEYHMAEIKDANEHPDNYTSKFLPATAGAIDGLVDAEIVIADAPTINAVEVVRCKDCIVSEIFQTDSNGTTARYCKAFTHLRMVADDDYCSYGERR